MRSCVATSGRRGSAGPIAGTIAKDDWEQRCAWAAAGQLRYRIEAETAVPRLEQVACRPSSACTP